jgi:hypothetical protein
MKLLGRDIPARELISRIEERLRTRGLPTSEPLEVPPEGVEPRVEPLTFNLHALEENADATRALPLHTHRGGAGQLVLVAKWAFRKSCQVFINEALGRQRVFNGHVRDSYAQLSAEVLRLRREVEELRARGGGGGRPPGDERPVPAVAPPAGPAERAPRTVEAAGVKPAPAPAARATRPPSTKASPQAKSTPETRVQPGSKVEPVLPQPRHTRTAASPQPRGQAGTPRTRPETPAASTPQTGQRPRKPGDKRRGRRK